MNNGDLVPDDIVTKLIFSELAQRTGTSWLLDGGYFTILASGPVMHSLHLFRV